MSPRHSLLLAGVLLSAALASPWFARVAEARALFVNGVRVDGMTNQRFENCDVRIDDKGDIHLTVKGVRVEVVPLAPVASQGPASLLTRRYFLVATQKEVGLAQYDVDVVINGQLAAKLTSRDPRAPLEVTRYLRPGQNTVLFLATKNLHGGTRLSTSSAQYLAVELVEGVVQGDRLVVQNQVTRFVRTAAETATMAEERKVLAR